MPGGARGWALGQGGASGGGSGWGCAVARLAMVEAVDDHGLHERDEEHHKLHEVEKVDPDQVGQVALVRVRVWVRVRARVS